VATLRDGPSGVPLLLISPVSFHDQSTIKYPLMVRGGYSVTGVACRKTFTPEAVLQQTSSGDASSLDGYVPVFAATTRARWIFAYATTFKSA
jgi:hypothetical protein